MSRLLAQVVPLAIGAALSPTLLVVVIVMLTGESRPRVRAAALVAGAGVVLVAMAVAIQLGIGKGLHGARHSDASAAVDLVLGALLITVSIGELIHRATHGPKEPSTDERSTGGPVRAGLLGVSLMAVNVSTLVLYVAALKAIHVARITNSERVLVTALVIGIILLPLVLPIALAALFPSAADPLLRRIGIMLTKYGAWLAAAIFLAFGVYLVVKGARGL
jgi:Sap, sulfolipid-1-addressing protein